MSFLRSDAKKCSQMKPFSNITGDLSGALSAAIITLPMSIGYGIIAYSPLGMDFAPAAALLGIYSAVLCCFVSALLGGTPIQISGPKAPLTLALGAVVACSIFGALPGAGSIPRSIANFRSGGRTRLSGMMCGIFILLMLSFCGSLFGKIPLAVIAGIIIVVGYSLFDR